jgi:hypothetical protein
MSSGISGTRTLSCATPMIALRGFFSPIDTVPLPNSVESLGALRMLGSTG